MRELALDTPEKRATVLDLASYDALGDIPESSHERFWVKCRLCGREVTAVLSDLNQNLKDRRVRRLPERRQRCSHRAHTAPARPAPKSSPGRLNWEDARALLEALGDTNPADTNHVYRRAVRRLRYMAERH